MKYKNESFLRIQSEYELFIKENKDAKNDKDVAEECLTLTSKFISQVLTQNQDLSSYYDYFPNYDCFIALLTNDELDVNVNSFRENIENLPKIKYIINNFGIIFRNNAYEEKDKI